MAEVLLPQGVHREVQGLDFGCSQVCEEVGEEGILASGDIRLRGGAGRASSEEQAYQAEDQVAVAGSER